MEAISIQATRNLGCSPCISVVAEVPQQEEVLEDVRILMEANAIQASSVYSSNFLKAISMAFLFAAIM